MSQPVDVSMPPDLDLGSGYTLRLTAIDATTGALVSGVKVSTVVFTAGQGSVNVGSGGGDGGAWALVPGPGA